MATKPGPSKPLRWADVAKAKTPPAHKAAPPKATAPSAVHSTPAQGTSSKGKHPNQERPVEQTGEKKEEVKEEVKGPIDAFGWGQPGAWDDWAKDATHDERTWGRFANIPFTVEDEMMRQASLHHELVQQIIPFWLKSIEAAEKGEPELKLEVYWDQHIARVKAAGWYWTKSDYDRDEARKREEKEERKANGEDDWSDHQEEAKENLWAANGWDIPAPSWDTNTNWQNKQTQGQKGQERTEGDTWVQVVSKARPAQDPWAGGEGRINGTKKKKNGLCTGKLNGQRNRRR